MMHEVDGERAIVSDKRQVGRTFSNESGFEEIDNETVRERKQLAYDGVGTLVVTISGETGELEAPPEIIARGIIGDEGNGFIENAQRIVAQSVASTPSAERQDTSLLKEHVRLGLKHFIQKQTGAKPVIMPVVVQV